MRAAAGCGMRDEGCGGCRMRGEGCGIRDAGCRMRGAGCGVQGAGCGGRMQVRGAGCRMRPRRRLPPGRPAAAGWLPGAPLALSHTCAVARQLGQSCNTSVRAGMGFLSAGCSGSLLRSWGRMTLVSLRKGTSSCPHLPVPSRSPRPRGLWPGRPGSPSRRWFLGPRHPGWGVALGGCRPHSCLGKVILRGMGTSA